MSSRVSTDTWIPVIAIVHAIFGLPYIVITLWIVTAYADVSRGGAALGVDLGFLGKYILLLALVIGGIGFAYLATAWGLWQFRSWARAMALAIAVVTLVGQVALLSSLPLGFSTLGGPTLVYIAVEALMVYYLLRPDVSQAFVGSGGQTFPLTRGASGGWGRTGPGTATERACPHCGYYPMHPDMVRCPRCQRGTSSIVEPPRPTTPPPQPPTIVPPVPAKQTPAWLVVRKGANSGQRFDLEEDTYIGRDSKSTVHLDDGYVSRPHARIRLENGQFVLYDLGSKGGTFANGQPVQRVLLYDGTEIQVGQTTLEFKRVTPQRQ